MANGIFVNGNYGIPAPSTNPPSISSQPQSVSFPAENAASFSVTSSGQLPLSYQWYFSTTALASSTNATLSLSGIDQTNTGNYTCVVTNSVGSITSSVASLTVTLSTNTHFIDFVNGSDSNVGTINFPIKTLAFNSTVSRLGKNTYLARGTNELWRESYFITESLLSAYGPTNLPHPKLSGAVLLTNSNWSLSAGWTNTYQYSIIPPSFTNPYVSISDGAYRVTNVLDVIDNDVRLTNSGGNYFFNFQVGYGAVSSVESNVSTYWWNPTNQILYAHFVGNGNPITNSHIFQASVRTLNLHGGGSNVINIDAEWAGAYDGFGGQGYQFWSYTTNASTVRGCSFRGGWNHGAGVANGLQSGLLVFADCRIGDIQAGDTCIAYKDSSGGGSTNSPVIWTNCLVWQPVGTGGLVGGFFSHGGLADVQIVNCIVTNVGTAASISGGVAATRTSIWLINGLTAIDCSASVSGSGFGCTVSNTLSYKSGWVNFLGQQSGPANFVNCTNIGVGNNYFVQGFTNTQSMALNITNCIFAWTNAASVAGIVFNLGTGPVNLVSNSFYGIDAAFNASPSQTVTTNQIAFSDYNNYFGLNSVAKNSPGTLSTLSAWKTAYPAYDVHSTTSDPGYSSTLWNRPAVVDPSLP